MEKRIFEGLQDKTITQEQIFQLMRQSITGGM
jgi:hypothetical protein